jgi:hypothetical protein
VRAARLLTEIGDCRARFPHPRGLFCLAGAAPSTRHPAKSRSSASVGRSTNSCTTPSATSPATAAWPTRGQPSSTPTPLPGARPPARGAHPGPGLALRHLALLARRQGLRPSQT